VKKNVASQSIGAEMITAADGTAFTGSVSVLVTKDNGTQTAGGATAPAHEGNGYHSYSPTQAETNADHIAFTFTGTGAIPSTVQLFTNFPQTVDNNTAIVALNDFNPSVDTVANVTLVATTTTNTDMVGTDNALLASGYTAPDNASISAILVDTNDLQTNQGNWLTATGFATTAEIADVPTVAEFNARTLLSASYFDPATDAVANVTLVATTTTNTDMVAAAPSAAAITSSVWTASTRILTASTNFNDVSVADILTTQMTESYSADGVAPTLAQSLFLTMQNLQDFSFAGTTQTVKKIDGSTTAATYTLDDAVTPTSKTRAS
jgi:hypothetical protein